MAPGAGADSNSPALLAIEEAVGKDVVVRRMDFPYRKAGRKAPDRQPVLVQSILDEVAAFKKAKRIKNDRLFIGGRSMGGRMCSIAAAEGLQVAGLVLISYPLHPPGKPDKLRVDHFPEIDVPCLFVSGTRDAFGTPKELKRHISKIKGDVTLHLVENADHGMSKNNAEVATIVRSWLLSHVF